MKNILIVEHGSYLKEFTFRKLKEKNCNILVATSKSEEWLLKYTNLENIFIVDTFDLQNITSNVIHWLIDKNHKIDAVGTFKESSVIPTADIAEALGCIGISGGAARRSSQNKLAMRYFLKKNGYKNQPEFSIVNVNDLPNKRIINYDAVLKPLFGSSSHGVIKIEKGEDLDEKIKIALLTISPNEREVFKNFRGHFILEQYIAGEVFSVDGIVQNGNVMFVGITEFIMGSEPYFIQVGSIIPANIDDEKKSQLYINTKEIINILGFNNCGFHAEFRVSGKSIYLIEIAARLPGGGIQLGYEKAVGVDIASAMIDVWLDNEVFLNPVQNCYVLHKSVFPEISQKSTLSELTGLHEISQRPEVWDFYQFANVGDVLYALPHTQSQLYYYAVEAPSREYLFHLSRELESMASFTAKSILINYE